MNRLKKIWMLAVGLLRELSDESAYARHLQATGRTHSGAEWRAFSDRRQRQRYQNAKCC